jgi:predicted Zn-ribbon and HTH transcriptional regulator
MEVLKMTEHEKDIKEIRALESIAKSLKSIDDRLKGLCDILSEDKTGFSYLPSEYSKPVECPECGYKLNFRPVDENEEWRCNNCGYDFMRGRIE